MTRAVLFTGADIRAAGPWSCGQVKCCYQSGNREARVADTTYVNEFWNSHQISYPSAFNGPMLGLVGLTSCDKDGLQLLVRRTSYAEYVATREPSFQVTHPQVERANPIGITIIAVSSDDMVVITRRSPGAEQNPGLPYFVGGYAEPPVTNEMDDVICANALRELTEELGVANIDAMFILGMAMDPIYCHPELFIITRLRIQASDVHEFWKGAQSREETGELMLLPISELLSIPDEVLFQGGVTWSFEAGAFLVRQCWDRVGPGLNIS